VITNGLKVFTDGAHKHRWGSWAYVITQNDLLIFEASGKVKSTDSLRMEIQAALEAIQSLSDQQEFEILTDCHILYANVLKLPKWKSYGWRKQNGSPIPHVDLYQKLDLLLTGKFIQWSWVKAHAKNPWNERCDQLCIRARGVAK